MFSIAAINDADVSRNHWQNLAPTKEAQEFRLTQMYHESLQLLQAAEYVQAQKLFQAIIKDPLSMNAEVENVTSSSPMLQLRFLAFKNLAEAFFKQGTTFYKDALQCFLQAVSIDGKDVALLNRLGTLACLLGSYNIARWAFEQGLQCSPNHWGCMEKLVEVLIAIGDEVACLSVVKQLLKISPCHPRAELVRRVIEDNVASPEIQDCIKDFGSLKNYTVTLRGIDKLKPQHYSLSFSKKRKVEDLNLVDGSSNKTTSRKILLNFEEASWTEVISKISRALEETNLKGPVVIQDYGTTGADCVASSMDPMIANAAVIFLLRGNKIYGSAKSFDTETDKIEIQEAGLSSSSAMPNTPALFRQGALDDTEDLQCEKRFKLEASWVLGSSCDVGSEKLGTLKERDASTDEEPPLERRSTRLERIRTRKFDKNEEIENTQLELGKSKVSCEALKRLLEPYLVFREGLENIPPFLSNDLEEEKLQVVYDSDEGDTVQFLREHVANSGLYHISQCLLEKISLSIVKPLESWTALVQLEKNIRNVSKGPTMLCSLFLAEVYMDMVTSTTDELEIAGYLQDCEYCLCKILDYIAVTTPSSGILWDSMPGILENIGAKVTEVTQLDNEGRPLAPEIKDQCWSFWVRYYWVSGHVRYYQGSYEKGRDDFEKCLSYLDAQEKAKEETVCITLPYCKFDNEISAERVCHKIYELQIQDLLTHSAAEMLEQGRYADLIELLGPILLSDEGSDKARPVGKKHAADFSTELTALHMLICASERSKPKNLRVALQCYEQRMSIHLLTAGFMKVKGAGNLFNIPLQGIHQKHYNSGEVGTSGDWFKMVAEEMRQISRCVADLGHQILDKSSLVFPSGKLLGRMQQLLVTLMCHIAMMQAVRRSSGLSVSDLLEKTMSTCFVDAAVSFCRLQHYHSTTSIKEQVDLLVIVHDVLAERGLCCAGKACEGGEGVFLKMAIKHLLALELKLKSGTPYLMSQTREPASSGNVDAALQESGSIADENSCKLKGEESRETPTIVPDYNGGPLRIDEAAVKDSRLVRFEENPLDNRRKTPLLPSSDEQVCDVEKIKMDLGLDIALDQSFFCLYGLNLRAGLESTGQDGLAVHANTSLGDYQTKEQCAEVFQYLLPYARVCTKACLVKLRKVLRAIRKQFPEPPAHVLESNAVDGFLDDLDFDEDKLSSIVLRGGDIKEVLSYALRTPSPTANPLEGPSDYRTFTGLTSPHVDVVSTELGDLAAVGSYLNNALDDRHATSGPYREVYGNLYYLLTQVEEICASDKWPGFVFTKEGEDFVEQNVKLFKYDLLYNPLRFESWHKLSNLYDEEVDLMLNDGSKTCNATEWHMNTHLTKKVETGRRRTRRCLLMSLALARTPEQKSQVHELLALVYYDTLQNVAPSYNQRQHVAVRNSLWRAICQKSFMHFEKALSFKSEWMYLFYLGKLCEKMGQPCEKSLTHYKKAAEMNSSAVDLLYRLHASRLKLLCSKGANNVNVIQVVARFCFVHCTKERVLTLLQDFQSQKNQTTKSDPLGDDDNKPSVESSFEIPGNCIKEAWNVLFDDCVKALEVCIEGELKHYHKARFRLAQGLFFRGRRNDVERAKEELGFCFKSNRSLFTINMWEIDGSTKRSRRKTPGSTGARRGFEISMPESSRKFITCLRKYLLFYLHLCEKTCDICTLERAYCSLRVDKKFSLCLADMINVTLGKYIHTLGAAICHFDTFGSMSNYSLSTLLEKVFNLFMEHGSSWSDIATVSLTEAGLASAQIVSEAAIYGYIHGYLRILECDNKVDILETVNEKIRKRFKIPKLVKEHCARVCRHAAVGWCRALCASLSVITPRFSADSGNEQSLLNSSDQLVVELRTEELISNISESYFPEDVSYALKQQNLLSSMGRVRIKQASQENMDKASVLLKHAFTFYRDCAGPFPVGINLFLLPAGSIAIASSESLTTDLSSSSLVSVDLSVPRKLLLWAYNLVHGRTCSIAEAVRFCEEQAKNKMKRGLASQPPCHERPSGSGVKEASSSGCVQLNNVFVVDEKDKSFTEDHETCVGGSCMVPHLDGAHPCSSSMCCPNQIVEDLTQGKEKSTVHFEYMEAETLQ